MIEAYNIQALVIYFCPTPLPLPLSQKETHKNKQTNKQTNVLAITVLQTAFLYFITLLFLL